MPDDAPSGSETSSLTNQKNVVSGNSIGTAASPKKPAKATTVTAPTETTSSTAPAAGTNQVQLQQQIQKQLQAQLQAQLFAAASRGQVRELSFLSFRKKEKKALMSSV